MIQHLIVLPVVLPLVAGILLLYQRQGLVHYKRAVSVFATLLLLLVSIALVRQAASGEITYYALGDWQPPFGVVLVLDRLSALMVLLTSLLAVGAVVFACGGDDEKGSNFHGLFQWQLLGINGAFLTGDLFNLFVFFEVLLLASYALLLHGGGKARIQASVHYVVLNLAGSSLFLIAVGILYGATGTLNMADMGDKLASLPAEREGLVTAGALMLLVVFGLKAAILPLYFWLPRAYAAAPAPVAALFAIMTKVGAYSILRMYTLVFGPEVGVTEGLIGTWLLPAAVLTLIIGCIGVLGTRKLGRLAAFGAIASMGTLLIAISVFTPAGTGAAMYYLVHSTLATAMLFLVADLVIERRGNDRIACDVKLPQNGLIASLFFAAAIAMAGMPPLSGFLGKLLVLDATRDAPGAAWIWAAILITSLIMIMGFARAGSLLFWKPFDPSLVEDEPVDHQMPKQMPKTGKTAEVVTARAPALPFLATGGLLVALIAMTVLAGPAMNYASATAQQLYQPQDYINAVLGGASE